MDNEPYRVLTHGEAADIAGLIFTSTPHTTYREVKLPNGKVADVLIVHEKNQITIIEVKTVLKDSLVNEAWEKYHPYCNQLFVGVPDLQIKSLADVPFLLEWTPENKRVGLLGIYRDSLATIRPALKRYVDANFRLALQALLNSR